MSETVTDGAAAAKAAGAHAGAAKKKKLIIIGAVVIGLLLLAGGGFWAKDRFFKSVGSTMASDSKAAQDALHPPIILGIPSLVSNLDSGDGRPVYVKLTAKVEVVGAPNEAALQNIVPQIQDIFQTYLHETRPQDLRGNGIYRLHEAIMRRLRVELAPLEVRNLYFVEFLVQ
ncbi:flagellar basal body-associated FliL family protein [Acetobacter peroxydans]|jgi:flagellar FliL protein|uniref:flagellar basal body-associated FliL family protein n=1 Tax=Acetobacter peroxydans TaxID=104098 RepID=UPI002354FA9F|nr:flagellar basal body-associated FliL family protein [Acetobacter peroxydans]MCH4142824.1 flagellar basal body-associated FliL family protein [Acetobacter peroxydans]MCI1394269.1 flagellar basal body-associated FliL family protein [Acetobacter peroxydans]MCI1411145.1 flagellar basal body-associated FliL family protein [Acetobacter peroxydans]MCI1438847.1 flagellar basal body-associated FliL family protein [Acetobacter peroxydans]MCI1566242.1 flagellar basal body-associated FliL family protei